jgi:S-formylglutathione hydrolase FrmB
MKLFSFLVLILIVGCEFKTNKTESIAIEKQTISAQRSSIAYSDFLTETGVLSWSKWAPAFYTTGFYYDVAYYIPQSLNLNEPQKVLVFLHGGGSSTVTREGAITAVNKYTKDMMKLADELGLVVVFPSSSGLNWGDHMRAMLKDLNREIRKNLNVDSNRIALAGHSMGGMGITRSAHWLAGEYNFIMPLAAGMDESIQTENNLWTNFNTRYYHINGEKDHFEVFLTRALNEQKAMKAIEEKYGKSSGYTLEFHPGNHQYNLPLVMQRMASLFEKPRDMYQSELFGSFYFVDEISQDNQDPNGAPRFYNRKPTSDYFWLEANWISNIKNARADFHVKINSNHLTVNLNSNHGLKSIRAYLSASMVDLTQPITVSINEGVQKDLVLHQLDEEALQKLIEQKGDKAFVYNAYVDIDLANE